MIRILHIVGTMDVGGLERLIMNVYRNIDRKMLQFDFVVHNDKHNYYEDEIISLGGYVHRVERKRKNIFKNIIQMYKLFKRNPQYKIIHIHTNSATCLTDLIVAKICNISISIVHSHSTHTGQEKQFLHKVLRFIMCLMTDEKFACSDLAAKWLFGDKAYNNNEVKIINNAIDAQNFIYNKEISLKCRKDLGIKQNTFVLGHIGSFSDAKNHSFLIDIFNAVRKEEIDSKLLIVGNGPFEMKIRDKINSLNLNDDVILTGLRSDIPEMLCAMDVFVFPSFFEGFPVTLVEAQASGLKCIISDTITTQVQITDLIECVSLNESAEYWASKVLSCKNGYKRGNTYQEIIKRGFDIKNEAKELQEFYIKLQGELNKNEK